METIKLQKRSYESQCAYSDGVKATLKLVISWLEKDKDKEETLSFFRNYLAMYSDPQKGLY